jgi:polyisoprenoid-binding protein YceI
VRALALVLAIAIAAADPSAATDWLVDPEASVITFEYVLDDRPSQGAFRKVSGSGAFDPDRPERTRLELLIDPTGLDLGDPLASAFAQSAEWFDSRNHPEVRYRLVRLTPRAEGDWLALGDVTIKGRVVIVETPVALAIGDGRAEAQGTVVFDRRDFAIGTGISRLFVTVGAEVSVSFDLVARPADPEASP